MTDQPKVTKADRRAADAHGEASCQHMDIEARHCMECSALALARHREEAVRKEREKCAKVAEAYLHNVPDEGGDELDHIGRYSNGTVRLIASAIRSRSRGEGGE